MTKKTISLVVPCHNEESNVLAIYEEIKKNISSEYDLEIIYIDDGSTDKTAQIAKNNQCRLINLDRNKGRAVARNIGAQEASGDVIVFIDSDVLIKKDALLKTVDYFSQDSRLMAVNGILSSDIAGANFVSDYKNLYMNFVFNQGPAYVDFIFSSFVAIKKE